jgi:hypothetical protein
MISGVYGYVQVIETKFSIDASDDILKSTKTIKIGPCRL